MTDSSIDTPQSQAARVAAIAYLISFVAVVVVNFGVLGRLLVAGNPAQTARNILAHETLFRIGVLGDMVYCVGVIVALTAFYVILKPVNSMLALLATFGWLIHGITWIIATLQLFTALRLLGDADYTRAFGDQLPVLVRLCLNGMDAYYVGLLFWSLGATIGSYLWFKSRYIPKPLAVFGVISSAWCVACTLVYYVLPGMTSMVNLWWFDSPMAVFLLVLSFWLLFREYEDRLAHERCAARTHRFLEARRNHPCA